MSTGDTRGQVQGDAQNASSASSRSTSHDDSLKRHKEALRNVAKRILFQCVPWPDMWRVSGDCIVASNSPLEDGDITTSDELGTEILSYVPLSLVSAFFTDGGQHMVSRLICYSCDSYATNRSPGQRLVRQSPRS